MIPTAVIPRLACVTDAVATWPLYLGTDSPADRALIAAALERDPDPTIQDVPEDPGEPTDVGEDDDGDPDVDSEEVTDA